MLTDNESRDEGSDRLFGEFDPDEFEILDEVGEEELIEQSNQIHEIVNSNFEILIFMNMKIHSI